MDETQKTHGRRVSGLRAGLHDAEEKFDKLIGILKCSEPDAVWIAEEGRENCKHALKRDERTAERDGNG